MNEHKCEECEHEKECLNMVCFYELLEKEEGKIRADEREKTLKQVMPILLEIVDKECCCYGFEKEICDLENEYNRIIEKEQTGEGRKVD